jgi:hypothetical protein
LNAFTYFLPFFGLALARGFGFLGFVALSFLDASGGRVFRMKLL